METSKSKAESRERAHSGAELSTPIAPRDSQEGTRELCVDAPDKTKSTVNFPSPRPAIENELPSSEFKPEADLEKAPGVPRGETESIKFEGEDENPAVPVSFPRSSSPATMQKNKNAAYDKVGEEGINRMHKFSLYETSTRFYLVGADIMDMHYRVLKIDRTSPPGLLNIFEDDIVYSKREMNQLLNAIDDGNKGSGGMKLKCSTWGLLGFIRFTEAYYMLLITKRAQVAMIGGHYIYQIDGTELIPLTTGSTSRFQKDRNPEEARFLGILNNLDLSRGFYFSYSYNITRSLQQNIIRERAALNRGLPKTESDFQYMFVWNDFLLDPARAALKNVYDWCHPIIHGYIDQTSLDVYGRRIYITIIARRSRFFAGARFLKRGANDLGYVANDVETEQIVSDVLNTSFHAPGPRLYASPQYTSYVQHRGSIPLYWTQDNSGVTPKPDIDLNLIDPFYSAAALHFDNLFERYGAPIYVLNLIKARERMPRESKLLWEYKNALDYLNTSLPEDKKILYEAFDMSRASKTRGQDVIGSLEQIGEKIIKITGFFHNGDREDGLDMPQVQNGVARTNCIDCLDRTNAAQFVLGKRALGRQLQALGVIQGKTVEYDTDCVEIFTTMFHNHGDQIAIQYGGSHLVNTMATYRKINHWQSSSRDMVESFKRYYHNSFLDSQRQEAYNLFLGNYIFAQGQPMLWDLTTDYYLHHEDPRTWLSKHTRHYIHWYNPDFLAPRTLPPSSAQCRKQLQPGARVSNYDDYWLEYYRPLALSSFLKIFTYRLNDKSGFPRLPDRSTPMRTEDISPFIVRKKAHDQDSQGKTSKKLPRKGVTIVDPSSETDARMNTIIARARKHHSPHTPETDSPMKQSILREAHFETNMPASYTTNSTSTNGMGFGDSLTKPFKPADKTLINQWTLAQFYAESLNPSVSHAEMDEYARYIEHPLNLPLVVNSETPSANDPGAMEFYEYLCMGDGDIQRHKYDDGASIRPTTASSEPGYYDGGAAETDSIRSFHSHTLPRPTSSLSLIIPFSHYPQYPLNPPNSQFVHSHNDSYTSTATAVQRTSLAKPSKFETSADDIEEFEEFLTVNEKPLDVMEEDLGKKRYKAYRQWLKGKSFFKQSKVDPEWMTQLPTR